MSLFVCSECGCVENTNCCHNGIEYDEDGNLPDNGFRNWGIMEMHGYRGVLDEREKTHMICSECNTGKWHGEWEKTFPTEVELAMANDLEDKTFTSHPLFKGSYNGDMDRYTLEQFEEDNAKRKAKLAQEKDIKEYASCKVSYDDDLNRSYDTKPFIRLNPKIGRNWECPCGSKKKYKKCCMNKIEKDI